MFVAPPPALNMRRLSAFDVIRPLIPLKISSLLPRRWELVALREGLAVRLVKVLPLSSSFANGMNRLEVFPEVCDLTSHSIQVRVDDTLGHTEST